MPDGDETGGFGELLAQMGQLQAQFSAAEASLDDEVVEGSAGGGVVVVRASGEFELDAVRIDPRLLELDDVTVLEDLVLAATRDALAKLTALRRSAIGSAVTGALGGLFGSLAGPDPGDDAPELGSTGAPS